MMIEMEDQPMAAVEKRTISLPPAQANYIDTLVEAGSYGSASEVVRAGLRALQERDAVIERWLVEEVVPAYDKMMANPGSGIPAEEVFASIREHHEKRMRELA